MQTRLSTLSVACVRLVITLNSKKYGIMHMQLLLEEHLWLLIMTF